MNTTPPPTPSSGQTDDLARRIAEALKIAESHQRDICTCGACNEFFLIANKLREVAPLIEPLQRELKEVKRLLEERYRWMQRNEASQSAAVESAFAANNRAIKSESQNAELQKENELLKEQIENLQALGIHTCHSDCQRPLCVLRRKNAELRDVMKKLVHVIHKNGTWDDGCFYLYKHSAPEFEAPLSTARALLEGSAEKTGG